MLETVLLLYDYNKDKEAYRLTVGKDRDIVPIQSRLDEFRYLAEHSLLPSRGPEDMVERKLVRFGVIWLCLCNHNEERCCVS